MCVSVCVCVCVCACFATLWGPNVHKRKTVNLDFVGTFFGPHEETFKSQN